MLRFSLILVLSVLFGVGSVLRVEAFSVLSAHVTLEHGADDHHHGHSHSHSHEKSTNEDTDHSHQLELSVLGQSFAVSATVAPAPFVEKVLQTNELLGLERALAPRTYFLSIFRPPIA